LPDVRGVDARRAQIGGPDGISQCFEVKAYIREPFPSSLARNLLSKDCWRIALGDEPSELGPEVALVFCAEAFAGGAERLARAAPSPDRAVVSPSSKSKSEGPSSDSCEEMALREFSDVFRSYIGDTPLVHNAVCDMLLAD
jgi:hypothetical protein